MKVAFTSTDGETIDLHFGHAREYWIWEVGSERAELLGRVSPLAVDGGDEEDLTTARANAISGCVIVYTQQVGGPAAAKLVARKIHPMKTGGAETPIAEAIARLQEVLRSKPPPWLRKAMGGEGRVLRFRGRGAATTLGTHGMLRDE